VQGRMGERDREPAAGDDEYLFSLGIGLAGLETQRGRRGC
jgi:hypothetical protein